MALTVRSVRAYHTPTALCLPFPISCNLSPSLPFLSLGIIPLISLTAPLSLSLILFPYLGGLDTANPIFLSITIHVFTVLHYSRVASSSLSLAPIHVTSPSSPLSLHTSRHTRSIKRKPPYKNDMPLMT